jgi:hypothetical protein
MLSLSHPLVRIVSEYAHSSEGVTGDKRTKLLKLAKITLVNHPTVARNDRATKVPCFRLFLYAYPKNVRFMFNTARLVLWLRTRD